jgi:hypothetical protein
MRTLPYDYARCLGTSMDACKHCRRTEPGREHRQVYMAPPIDRETGECSEFIGPARKDSHKVSK